MLFVAVATLSGGILTSCGKSTKGKIDGDWTIDSMSETSTDTYSDGSTSTGSVQFSGTTLTVTYTSGGNTTTNTGTVSESSMSFKKDGTWERTFTYAMTETYMGMQYVTTTTNTESGNWDFLNGVGEFKKNERIAISTLNSKSVEVTSGGGMSSTTTDTETFADGENSEIYVITESKKKSLMMEMDSENSYSNTSGGSTSTSRSVSSRKLSLTAE